MFAIAGEILILIAYTKLLQEMTIEPIILIIDESNNRLIING